MFKEAYEQIKRSYESGFIYPPVLLADSSLGNLPNLLFLVVYDGKADAVVVNSQDSSIMGVTSMQENPMNEKRDFNIDDVDRSITRVCELLVDNNAEVKEVYTDYLQRFFQDSNDLHTVASFCPNAISKDILIKLGNTPRAAKEALSQIGRKVVFMEKDTPEILKNIPEWIESVPTARAYKNAVIAGNGDKLFRIIKFSGNDEAYKTCSADFAQFLFKMNMATDETVYETMDGCIHSNIKPDSKLVGHYWFFDDMHNPPTGIGTVTFNISSVKTENALIKSRIEAIGLIVDYDTMEIMLEDYPGWENVSEADFVNHTLLTHYETSNDDVLKVSDLSWLEGAVKQMEADSHDKQITQESNKNNETDVQADTARENTTVENTKCNDISKETSVEPQPVISIPPTEVTHEDTVSVDENTSNESEEDIPDPDTASSNVANEEIQEEIQEETVESALSKIKHNQSLNDHMFSVYEATAARLKAERDPRWSNFISEYKKAMEEETYNVRTCPRYLTMTSRDIKNPIYKVLYDADMATKKYEADLQRIVRHSMCFACQTPFDADITFARNKEHLAKCPNCGNLVRMTIDWID